MPIYEYRCRQCGRKARFRFSFAEYDQASPRCPHCGSVEMNRCVSRTIFLRAEESRLEDLMSDDALASMEDDPRAMGRFMRQMSREMGEEMDGELDEVAGRLEKGESIDSIEQSMPGLGETGDIDDAP